MKNETAQGFLNLRNSIKRDVISNPLKYPVSSFFFFFSFCSESAILYQKLEIHIYSMQIPNEIQLNTEGTTAMTEK